MKITNVNELKAAIEQVFDDVRIAMIEAQKTPFPQYRQLQRTYLLLSQVAKVNLIDVKPLPQPKSIVQGAPKIVTAEALKEKAIPAPPPPAGDVLADNAPSKRSRKSKGE